LVEQNVNVALSISSFGYVLENGRVGFKGTTAELSKNEVIQQLYFGGTG